MRITNFPDESITEQNLRDLIETMPPDTEKQLRLVVPSGEHWIFLVSFNFDDPVVLLELTGTGTISVNGRACNRAITLIPGAHAFSVTASGLEVEHRVLALNE
jgi:hypothetical protein